MNEQINSPDLSSTSGSRLNRQQQDNSDHHAKKDIYERIDKDLNSKILKITMDIKENYPELSKYIEEMPVTIPNEQNPEMSLRNLKSYYESLNTLLNDYISMHENLSK
jgi:hypothetical protein